MDSNQPKFREEQLRQWSREFPYPATPDIAGAVHQRLKAKPSPSFFHRTRLAWVAIVILVFVAMMAVPSVRAQVLEFLQIGAIRIFLSESTPMVTPDTSPEETGSQLIMTATPISQPAVYPSIADLAGETTLDEAQNELDFPIQLPTYPSDLGNPDRIFLQDFEGPAVLLVWLEPDQPEQIRMNLLILGPDVFAQKGAPTLIAETSVNGQRAIWTEGPHFLYLGGSMYQTVTLVVEGNILVWEQDGLTYRLETDLPLEEAVKVAESLE